MFRHHDDCACGGPEPQARVLGPCADPTEVCGPTTRGLLTLLDVATALERSQPAGSVAAVVELLAAGNQEPPDWHDEPNWMEAAWGAWRGSRGWIQDDPELTWL